MREDSNSYGVRGTAWIEDKHMFIKWDDERNKSRETIRGFDRCVKSGIYEILNYDEQISSRKRIDIQD